MKVCFLMQRRFAYIAHDLAVHLKKFGVNDFCGYVTTRPSFRFLQSQNEIKYSSLLLDEDLHNQAKNEKLDRDYIMFLEKEYGMPNLWPYIEVDRIIRYNQLVREYPMDTPVYSHEEMMIHVQVRAKAIIAMLEKEKPDFIVCSVVASIGSLLLYNVAKKMGIEVRIVMPTKVGSRYGVSSSYERLVEIDNEFEQLLRQNKRVDNFEEAKEVLNSFRENPLPPDSITNFYLNRASRMKQLDFLLPSKLKRYILWLIGKVKYYFKENDKHDYSYIKTFDKIKDQLARKLRAVRGVDDLYDEIQPDKEDFAFFPLHLEPEVALHLYGYWYINQIEAVRQIARSLPVNYKLYVKDHPRMVGFRKRSYYKELKKIPNVKLVNPKINSLQFLAKSKLAIVITGSAGWEAIQLKVPVITFGDVFFNKLSMVKRCDSYERLPNIVAEQLNNFNYNEEEIINYIGLALKHSVILDLSHLWHREPDKKKKREKLSAFADLLFKSFTQ